MAGTAIIRVFATVTNLGHSPPISTEYTLTGIDEMSYQYQDLGINGSATVAINVGVITTVTGFVIKLVSGGTTASTGLSVDLSTDEWAATDFVILSGESIFLRPLASTMSVKNLDSSACVIEYLVFGEG